MSKSTAYIHFEALRPSQSLEKLMTTLYQYHEVVEEMETSNPSGF